MSWPLRIAALSKGGGGLLSLWAEGGGGFLYYPFTKLSNFFTTSGGSTNVAADGDPIGRIVDFSPSGNNAMMATTTRRPLYKTNSAKPYALFDGSDDCLPSNYIPNATSGLTMAVAFNNTSGAVQSSMLGGGAVTGSKRAFIALTPIGSATIGWGSQDTSLVARDLRNANHVLLVQGTGATRTIWLDGVDITANFAAASSFPDGSGGSLTLAGRQNTVGGSPDNPMAGRISAALAIGREVTAAERNKIFKLFQETF